ncbi:MAG: hypothetical protein OXG33_04250 [Chloroflexi bacterium]|nr:hypothetical protein [Chloroflexota bacterium]
MPVYELLGGKHRDFVPGFATASAPYGPKLVEDLLHLHADGWPAIRLGLDTADAGEDGRLFEPRESIGLTAEWVIRVREALRQLQVLGLDYHHRQTVDEAASFHQRPTRAALDSPEEPIRDQTPEAYETLRSMTRCPSPSARSSRASCRRCPKSSAGWRTSCASTSATSADSRKR